MSEEKRKIKIRVPQKLKIELVEKAKEKNITLNTLIKKILVENINKGELNNSINIEKELKGLRNILNSLSINEIQISEELDNLMEKELE